MKIQPSEIYQAVAAVLPPDQIAHWCSDLYIKATPETENLIANYEYKNQVHIFRDQITGAPWYEIPFVYPGRL